MRTVYFFTSPMCGACEEWKPTVDAFIAANTHRVIALRCNPNLKAYQLGKWKVKYTPSAAVMEGGELLWYSEGHLMSAIELEAFVFGSKWKPATRTKRLTAVDEDAQADAEDDADLETEFEREDEEDDDD